MQTGLAALPAAPMEGTRRPQHPGGGPWRPEGVEGSRSTPPAPGIGLLRAMLPHGREPRGRPAGWGAALPVAGPPARGGPAALPARARRGPRQRSRGGGSCGRRREPAAAPGLRRATPPALGGRGAGRDALWLAAPPATRSGGALPLDGATRSYQSISRSSRVVTPFFGVASAWPFPPENIVPHSGWGWGGSPPLPRLPVPPQQVRPHGSKLCAWRGGEELTAPFITVRAAE